MVRRTVVGRNWFEIFCSAAGRSANFSIWRGYLSVWLYIFFFCCLRLMLLEKICNEFEATKRVHNEKLQYAILKMVSFSVQDRRNATSIYTALAHDGRSYVVWILFFVFRFFFFWLRKRGFIIVSIAFRLRMWCLPACFV